MRAVNTGKTYSGEELEKLLGDTNERLCVLGNDHDAIVAVDVGNNNYEVLGVLHLDNQPQGVKIYLGRKS